MLQKIRDHFHGWFFRVVLGALILVFAAWGAYGIVDVGFTGSSYAAKANGDSIPLEEATREWRRQQARFQQMFGGEIPDAQRKALEDSVLENMILERLLNSRAQEAGYRVSQAELSRAVAQIPAFQIEGKYSPEAAKATLAAQGLTPAGFETEMRHDLQRTQVQNAIGVSEFVTPGELARIFALENEEREVRYALLPADRFMTAAKVSDAAIEAYYTQHQAEFMNPEWARVEFGDLRVDQVAASVEVTDEALRGAYAKSKSQFVTPEKRRASHILIKVSDPKDGPAALAKAQQVLAEAKSGKDFAALARQYSEDPGSAAQGGDLGWAERSYFVGPFSDAVFSMQPGEIRGPVKTQFGYHIIKLDGLEAGKSRSFEEVRPELEAQLRRDRSADRFGDLEEQLQARLEQPNANFDALVREFHLATGEVADFKRGSGGAPLGASPELQDVVFSKVVADEGRVGGPVALGEDRIVIVKVQEHHPASPKPLAEVRAEIAAAVAKAEGTAAARVAADAALKRLDGGESLEAVAKGLGVTLEPERFIGRGDPSIPAQIRQAVFEAPKPTAGKPVNRVLPLEAGGAAIVSVSAVRTGVAPVDANLQLRETRVRELTDRRAKETVTAYLDELRREAKVEKNPKVFDSDGG
jgi:peptidyl-prolyl cis-trans isomerase D